MAISACRQFKSATACFVIAVLFSLVACQTTANIAGKTVFYQPLNQDRAVTPLQWQQLFQAAASQGFNSLVVQWSRYDDVDFMAQDAHLQSMLQAAQQYHFTIWLGLGADSNYFARMQQAEPLRQRYFRLQLAHNLLLLNRLKSQLPVSQKYFAGWYLPAELNDNDFRTQAQLHWMTTELKLFKRSIAEPVAISVFSNGVLAPADYLQALQQLSDTGLQIWLQDGAGAGLISPAHRQQLLTDLPCHYAVIAEQFRQPDVTAQPFRARAAAADEAVLAQQAIKPCHAQWVFSLRYLPFAKGILNFPGE
jgi:hypothetical protein